MTQRTGRLRDLSLGILGVAVLSIAGVAQEKPLPDAQVESNVLKSLAGAPELAVQAIGTTTVYGTVTLTGSVRDEASRDKAEQLVANTAGVKKVVDELVIGAPADTSNTGVSQPGNEMPEAQSDGTIAGSDQPQAQNAPMPQSNTAPAPVERSQTQQQPAYPQQPYPPQPQAGNGYPQQPYPTYPRQQPYRVQQAGQPVVVPAGTIL